MSLACSKQIRPQFRAKGALDHAGSYSRSNPVSIISCRHATLLCSSACDYSTRPLRRSLLANGVMTTGAHLRFHYFGSSLFSTFSRSPFVTGAQVGLQRKNKDKDAKGGKGGDKDKQKNRRGGDDEEEGEGFDLEVVRALVRPPISHLTKEFSNIRATRANSAMLEKISVQTDEGKMPLYSIAQVSMKDGQHLLVSLFDDSHVKATDKAIKESGQQVTTQIEGTTIKVSTPKMTTEYRDDLKKTVQQHAEKAKNQIRVARKTGMDLIKKAKLPKDDEKVAEKDLQKVIDEATKQIDQMAEAKTKEISSLS